MDSIRIDNTHEQAQLLLPWFATGTLDDADRTRVSDHLVACAVCRADLEAERKLRTRVAAMTPAIDLIGRRCSNASWPRVPRAIDGVARGACCAHSPSAPH